ncbi:alkaline phosphatase family protein [Paenibacillus thalictri]|uniref:Nucleotide pyrophosphatase n=1 Tax=Paenibacillus thalictri TaxID=2527873 RepID=A0A4Q9DRU7_9BACL|nr:alkaline phosphatase family protein [Paenibacillus thalictri]TBL78605.1 nucleotide pyrophosphatase [Paenibacillus thalictri]
MSQQVVERVVIIGVDGAGNYVTQAHTPQLDALFASSAHTFEAQTVFPTISAECWGAMLYGVLPEEHGLNNDIAAASAIPDDFPHRSVFGVARHRYPDAKLASFCCWSPINTGILESAAGVHTESLPDEELPQAAIRYMRENPDFKLLQVIFDGVDAAGHKFGYGTADYLDVITATDGRVGEIIEALKQHNLWEGTALITVTDHGGGGLHETGHGSDDPRDMTIFWSVAGPGIHPGLIKSPVSILDTAPVIAKLLELPVQEKWKGSVPGDVFLS